MKRNESIRKVMTSQLTTAHTAMPVSQARQLLEQNSFHHLPVVSGDELVGMISALDMTRVDLTGWGTDRRSLDAALDAQFSIEDLMTKEVETLPIGATVKQAALVLSEGRFHSVPVVDDKGRLEGLVTTTDLVRFLADQF